MESKNEAYKNIKRWSIEEKEKEIERERERGGGVSWGEKKREGDWEEEGERMRGHKRKKEDMSDI